MDLYMVIVRILHIVAGVFWVGAGAFFFFFIEPTATKLGPGAGPFMTEMTVRRKMPIVFTVSAVLTIVAGGLLYWRSSGGFDLDWITSETGMTFTLGAIAAILAFLGGLILIRPRVERMSALGGEIQGAGGPPSQEQMAEMQRLQHSLRSIGRVDLILLTFAVVAMAAARYL